MSSLSAFDSRAAWRKVSLGLSVKSIGAWAGLIGLAFLGEGLPFVSALRFLAVGVLLDFTGRVLCSAAPIIDRRQIYRSIGVQAFGICLIGALIFVDDIIYRGIGVLLVALSQVTAAFLFTAFLGEVAQALGRPDLEEQVELLQRRLANSVTTITKFGLQAIIFVVLFFSVIITVLVLCIFLPLYPLLLGAVGIPVAIAMVSLAMMFSTYHTTLLKIRAAIIKAGTDAGDPGFDVGNV